jgi:hypothetical protein
MFNRTEDVCSINEVFPIKELSLQVNTLLSFMDHPEISDENKKIINEIIAHKLLAYAEGRMLITTRI